MEHLETILGALDVVGLLCLAVLYFLGQKSGRLQDEAKQRIRAAAWSTLRETGVDVVQKLRDGKLTAAERGELFDNVHRRATYVLRQEGGPLAKKTFADMFAGSDALLSYIEKSLREADK